MKQRKWIHRLVAGVIAATMAVTMVTWPGKAEAATAKVVESGDYFTLTDDGTLRVTSNAFTYKDVSEDNRSFVTTMVFSGEVNTIRCEMTGPQPSSISDHGRQWAFLNCHTVVMENGVTTIGKNAFYSHTGPGWGYVPTALKHVTMASTVTDIGESAFYECVDLETISIPDAVTTIPESAFQGCSSLKTVYTGKNVDTIGDLAFWKCTALKKVTLGENLEQIGESSFSRCTALTTINLKDTKVTSLGDYAFYNCDALETLAFSATLKQMGEGVLEDASGLEEITLPAKVTSIPDRAFYNCRSLTKVTFSSKLTSIGANAFDTTALTSITFPASLNKIDAYAFNDTSLKTITFKGRTPVANINENAFKNVSKAKGYYPALGNLSGLREKFSDIKWTGTGIAPGKQKINGKWCYISKKGKKLTGWIKDGKKKYYANKSGVLQTGKVKIGTKYYYFSPAAKTYGEMKTGWVTIKKKKYFFRKTNGVMARNEYFKGYRFNKDGSWTYKAKASWKKDKNGWRFGDSKGWYAKNQTLTINNKKYTFNKKGYRK